MLRFTCFLPTRNFYFNWRSQNMRVNLSLSRERSVKQSGKLVPQTFCYFLLENFESLHRNHSFATQIFNCLHFMSKAHIPAWKSLQNTSSIVNHCFMPRTASRPDCHQVKLINKLTEKLVGSLGKKFEKLAVFF